MLCLITSMIELFMIDLTMLMIYLFQNLIMQLPNNSTIQKPYNRQSGEFTIAGFADALRLDKSSRVHFKRWQGPSLAYCVACMGSEAWYSSR
jgi:hypothetical protein